jgi:hypothetical protein
MNCPFSSHELLQQNYWDVTIFHEPTFYLHNRPKWFVNNENNFSFKFDLKKVNIDFPIRIKLLSIKDR